MGHLWYSFLKELKLLARDWWGLAIVIIMPIILATVVTLVHEDAFSRVRGSITTLYLVNSDKGEHGARLAKSIAATPQFSVVTRTPSGAPLTEASCRELVSRGEAPFCIVIPEKFSETLDNRVFSFLYEEETASEDSAEGKKLAEGRPRFISDPVVMGNIEETIATSLDMYMLEIETKVIFVEMADKLGEKARQALEKKSLSWKPGGLVGVKKSYATKGEGGALPTSVQHNVPAWTLFAMFLVIVPLSGSLIKERDQGTLTRLRTLPMSPVVVPLAKALAYVLVCFAQFAAMVALGMWILPLLGTPVFTLGPGAPLACLLALVCALAATGLGIMFGSVARTTEQATAFGSTFAVLAAIVGGVTVPTMLMPGVIKFISQFSPMNWGLNAFLDIFMHNAGFFEIMPQILKLLALAAGSILVSAWCYKNNSKVAFGRPRTGTHATK